MIRITVVILALLVVRVSTYAQSSKTPFTWPGGYEAAISLTFDDGRNSQVDSGTVLLDKYGIKATFYVVPSAVEQRLGGWKNAVASGHEIGNHSLRHPCSGNFAWSRDKALEHYSPQQMDAELAAANKRINELLGVTPKVFAYPCGHTFVGRGVKTQSYVPVVARSFVSGRGWLDEAPNDPVFCDLAQLTGMESDGKTFEEILTLIEQARKDHTWLVLAGHEMGHGENQTTRLNMLRELLPYLKSQAGSLWVAPVGTISEYVRDNRPSIR